MLRIEETMVYQFIHHVITTDVSLIWSIIVINQTGVLHIDDNINHQSVDDCDDDNGGDRQR